MAIYETVVILDSLLPPKEIDDIVEHFSNVITENGGKVRTVDKWGKRRLAYEIHKKQYGFYFAIEFEGTGNIALVLQSEYNFNDNVLRYLTYSYDKHKIKSMAKKPNEKPVEKKPVEVKKPEAKVKAEVETEVDVEVDETPDLDTKEETSDEQE